MTRDLWHWWFEDRRTGRITVWQPPNLPVLLASAASAVRIGVGEPATRRIAGRLEVVLWCWWGCDELLRGVNPWRRALGACAIVGQAIRLARSRHR
jgi:hypothetical protein